MIDLEISRITTITKALLLGVHIKIGNNYYYMHNNCEIGYDSVVIDYSTNPPIEKSVTISDNLTLEKFIVECKNMSEEQYFKIRSDMRAIEIMSPEKVREKTKNIIKR